MGVETTEARVRATHPTARFAEVTALRFWKIVAKHPHHAWRLIELSGPFLSSQADSAWDSAIEHPSVVAFESTLRVQDAPEVVREAEGKPLNRSVDGIAKLSEHCIAVDEGREPPCGCVGEMHNEGCRCSCTDRTTDPLCLIHAAKPLSPDRPKDHMQHERNCPAWKDMHGYECGDSCTCGLKWRIQMSTEQSMHAAWRKRAEEAEAALSSTRPEGEAKVSFRVEQRVGKFPDYEWVRVIEGDSEDVFSPYGHREYTFRLVKIETYETVIETRKKEA